MEEQNQNQPQKNQIQKSFPTECSQDGLKTYDLSSKKAEALQISKNIVAGTANLMQMEMNASLKENINSPAITSIFKNENTEIGLNVIKVLVDRFADSFGFATKMSATQSETLCIDTFDNFKGESLGDIILFFKMARNGSFGSTHRGIDSNLIFGDWFPKYLVLKAEERERVYQKQKSEQIKGELSIEQVREAYRKEQEKGKLEKVVAYVDKITTGITREELETMISEWRKDTEKNKFIRVLLNKRLEIK